MLNHKVGLFPQNRGKIKYVFIRKITELHFTTTVKPQLVTYASMFKAL